MDDITVKELLEYLKEQTRAAENRANWLRLTNSVLEELVEDYRRARMVQPRLNQAKPRNQRHFTIRLGDTNYEMGMFNIPVSSDGLVMKEEGNIMLKLPPDNWVVTARLVRNQNRNGTARVMGGATLKHWFQDNYSRGDEISIEVFSEDVLIVGASPRVEHQETT